MKTQQIMFLSMKMSIIRCISHASEGALCLSEPRSAAVYIIASGDRVNAPSSSSSPILASITAGMRAQKELEVLTAITGRR